MKAMISKLTFQSSDAAQEELAELQRQATSIRELEGFRAVFGIRVSDNVIVIVRVFETIGALSRSLAGPLRPDLAAQFAEKPLRLVGDVVIDAGSE
jgi:hypothetical protein